MINKLFVGIFCLISYAALSAQHVAQPLECQEKEAIVFDIHGVLTKVALWKMAKTIFWGLWEQPSLIFKLHPKTFSSGAYVEYPILRAIYNCHEPRPEIWHLVHKLKAAGYPIYVFSNIHDVTFADFCAGLPEYFDVFDGCHIIKNNNLALRKPAATAYDACKALIAQKHPDHKIIFIDDKKSNVRAGEKAGLTGIIFGSVKQLQKELAGHNIHV